MKSRLLIIIGFVGFLSLISFIPHNAYACSCGGKPDFLLTWMTSEGAFQANVTKVEQNGDSQKIYFDISLTQKGLYSGHYVHEQYSRSTCNVDYTAGETYQVFMWASGNQMFRETDICSTKQITGFDEYSHEDEHGQMQHYRQEYNFFTQYNLLSLIIPAIIASIFVGFLIRRK
jgi:hypothetical protein